MKALYCFSNCSTVAFHALSNQNSGPDAPCKFHGNHWSVGATTEKYRNARIMCNAVTKVEMDVQEGSKVHEKIEEGSMEDKEKQINSEENMERPGGDEEDEGIARFPVPRQRYISISKMALVESLMSLFSNPKDAQDFLSISSCLDSILHAEHKSVLEEMRLDFSLTHSHLDTGNLDVEEDVCWSSSNLAKDEKAYRQVNEDESLLHRENTLQPRPQIDEQAQREIRLSEILSQSKADRNLGNQFSPFIGNGFRILTDDARVMAATRFQRNFLQLLLSAEFQELSTRDLQLTTALNTDYLLNLPIDVDWKRASLLNAIIFRRGYTTEKQDGFLIGAKLDYLQSMLLQNMFNSLSQPLFNVGMWINERWKRLGENEQTKIWTEGIKRWLKEPLWPKKGHRLRSLKENRNPLQEQFVPKVKEEKDLPIWLAAQQAIPRYEYFLSSAGSRGRLLRKLLVRMGLLPSEPLASISLDSDSSSSEPYLRPNFLSRVSLRDIWKPATREVCGNDVWRRFRAAFSVLFSQSSLQEPTFKELVLLYTAPMDERGNERNNKLPTLQLKIYKRIPIPDLKVIFPNKKLSFRILDTVRLDIATILGLLAYFVNYKFEDFLISPSAFMLDVIAIGALIIFVTRVVLGYKQTWDRYQLLVNRTLYEKTLASGFGTVHFLVDASEQQEFKEAIVAYALILQAQNNQVKCRKSIADLCERFLFSKFKVKIEMPIDKAMETLLRLGLVSEDLRTVKLEGKEGPTAPRIKALSCSKSYAVLKERWDNLLLRQ